MTDLNCILTSGCIVESDRRLNKMNYFVISDREYGCFLKIELGSDKIARFVKKDSAESFLFNYVDKWDLRFSKFEIAMLNSKLGL